MEKTIDGKTGTSVSLKHSTYLLIKEKGLNLSAEIEEMLEKKYMNKEERLSNLIREKEKIEVEIESVKKEIEESRNQAEQEIKTLSPEKINELIESIHLTSKQGISMNARYNRYNHIFGENITLDKFKWLMEQVRQIHIK